jgi:hypothetical protein
VIIDLATVKIYLGLTANTYDSQISAFIPDVDALIKDYCNCEFADDFWALLTSASDTIEIASGLFPQLIEVYGLSATPKEVDFKVGDSITGTGISAGTFITRKIYTGDILTHLQLSAVVTTGGQQTLIRGINRGYFNTVSKIIGYLISKTSITVSTGIKSESVGGLSVTYSDDAINEKYGVPQSLLNSLPKFARFT